MKILNANYETVKKRLLRAKAKLLKALEEEGYNDEQ
jgi:DNA-directed RNA polymerase specialized sigma24 family protein